jgi:hypothetical protein
MKEAMISIQHSFIVISFSSKENFKEMAKRLSYTGMLSSTSGT